LRKSLQCIAWDWSRMVPGLLEVPDGTRRVPREETTTRFALRTRTLGTPLQVGKSIPRVLTRSTKRAARIVLLESWLYDRSEGVPRSIQPALHRPEVTAGDLGDFLVRLPFQLAEYEHLAVMLRKLRD
jgi:hypothetical protein